MVVHTAMAQTAAAENYPAPHFDLAQLDQQSAISLLPMMTQALSSQQSDSEAESTPPLDRRFQPIDARWLQAPSTDTIFWLRLPVRNLSAQPIQWTLSIELPLLAEATLYQRDNRGGWRTEQQGIALPVEARINRDAIPWFSINTAAATTESLYLRLRVGQPLLLFDITARTPKSQQRYSHDLQLIIGIWFGMLLLAILNHIVQILFLHDENYIYTGALAFSVCLSELAYWGYLGLWLNIEQTISFLDIHIIVVGIQNIFALRLTRQFLDLKKYAPQHDWVYRKLDWLAPPLLLLFLFLPDGAYFQLVWVFIASSYASVIFFYLWRQGHPFIKLFALSWPPLLLSATLMMLRNLGVISSDFGVVLSYIASITISVLTISLLPTMRVSRMMQDTTSLLSSVEKSFDESIRLRRQLQQQVVHGKHELKEEQLRFEREQQGKRALLSLISHDLRGPLRSAALLSQRLRQQLQPDPQQIQRLDETLQQQIDLIDRLLDIETLRMRKQRMTQQQIDLAIVVENRLQHWRQITANVTQQLTYRIRARTMISVDLLLINTLLDSLIANAIQHSPAHAMICIEADHRTPYQFTIHNSGVTIPPEKQLQIFDAGYTTSTARDEYGSGRGLGLPLIRELIRQYGGDLQLLSPPEGVTFQVILPPRQRYILLVDDQPVQLDQLAHRIVQQLSPLEREAVVIINCDCVDDALKQLKEQLVDLIVSDVQMPKRDGFELLKAVRANPQWEEIPFIMMSSASDHVIQQKYQHQADQFGADALYQKPITAQQLFDLLKSIDINVGLELTDDTEHAHAIHEKIDTL